LKMIISHDANDVEIATCRTFLSAPDFIDIGYFCNNKGVYSKIYIKCKCAQIRPLQLIN